MKDENDPLKAYDALRSMLDEAAANKRLIEQATGGIDSALWRSIQEEQTRAKLLREQVTGGIDNALWRSIQEEQTRTKLLMEQVTGRVDNALQRSILEEQTRTRRLMEQATGSIDHTLWRAIQGGQSTVALNRCLQGPLADIVTKSGYSSISSETGVHLAWIEQARAEYDRRFRLPELDEAQRHYDALMKQTNEANRLYFKYAVDVDAAFSRIQKPWLDSQDPIRSVRGFAELQGIGHAINSLDPFSDSLAAALRPSLGDWRDQITFPDTIFNNLLERSAFYEHRGFDSALSDFPPETFAFSADVAGLNRAPPPLIAIYESPVPPSDDVAQEEEFVRANQAHDWLQRFESHLRQFLDNAMTERFGPNWANHRLPNGMYNAWREKQKNAERAGRNGNRSIIAYADFTDYEKLICRDDNWKAIFYVFFGRPESVRETFQRLYPLRIDTMHSRQISHDDQIFLWVETRRIMRAISKFA